MKEDNIYTSEDGTRYVNYGRAFGDTEEVSRKAAIRQAQLLECLDGLDGLAYEMASESNGCFLRTLPCKNGKYVTFLNRNIGKLPEKVANHPVVKTKAKATKAKAKVKVA